MLAGRLKNQARYLGDKTIDNCEKEIADLDRIIWGHGSGRKAGMFARAG
jgi:hypothetical protein